MSNITDKLKFSCQSKLEADHWIKVIKVNIPGGKNIKNIKTPKEKDGRYKVYIDIE